MTQWAPLCFLILSGSLAHADSYRVLLTSFDPFGGSSANNSQAVVRELSHRSAELGPGVELITCNLPVEYDVGAAAALACVDKNRPDAVVSFGEAACGLRMETAANNLDDTPELADNSGVARVNVPIVGGAPARTGFAFPVPAMYCALEASADKMPVEVSKSPGYFICNNVAYHLTQELGARKMPFTFIHVPNSKCADSAKDPAANAKTVAVMLKGAIAALRRRAPPPLTRLPTTAAEVMELAPGKAPRCEKDFARELAAAYR